MRRGLQKSKNLVAIRTLNYITPQYAQQYAAQFGFDPAKKNPAYLTMALGAGAVTPLQLANGYAVFANGGYRVAPWLIAQVADARGTLISQAKPTMAGKDAPRIISERNAYIMDSLLQSVAQHGTAANSNILKRTDLAGKTGTTNDAVDGWFAGYQHSLVAVTWLATTSRAAWVVANLARNWRCRCGFRLWIKHCATYRCMKRSRLTTWR